MSNVEKHPLPMEASIQREATRELARSSVPTVFVYPLLIALCGRASPMGTEHPTWLTSAIVCALLAGLWRLHTSRCVLAATGELPPGLLTRYRLSVLMVGGSWGVFAASAVYHYGSGWASQLAQVVTVGLLSGATTTLVSDVFLFRLYALLMIAPSALLLAGLNGQQAWSSLVLAVFTLFIVLSARVNAHRYWTSLRNKWQLEEKTRDLERVSQAKSDFLATMSHEIRTPMNAVFGMTQLLLDTELTDCQREWTESVHSSCEALLGIISDILDLSKIEAGRMELEQVAYEFRECLQSVVSLFEPVARSKGLALNCDLTPLGDPLWLLGDRTRVRQILTNFLSNSVKFTSEGQVDVSVCRQEAWLQVCLRDTGVGISASKIDRLFETFSQSDASITRQFGGSGLGLSVCRNLAKLMDAHVWGVSGAAAAGMVPDDFALEPVEQGSIFYLRLPLRVTTAPAEAVIEKPSRSLLPPRDKRILLAEDNSVNQKVALAILTRLGYPVEVVNNGLEALNSCLKTPFDVIFMDVQMPVLDGITATERLRRLHIQPQPWIIALTANAFREDRDRCLAAGMDDFLSKPVRETDFVRALVRYALTRR